MKNVKNIKKSSFIKAMTYQKGELTIQMVNGKIYKYHGVQRDVAARFHKAESYGKFYNTNIKDQYECEEIL